MQFSLPFVSVCFVCSLVVQQNQVYLCHLCNVPRKNGELCSSLLRHQNPNYKILNLTVSKNTVLSSMFLPYFKLNLQMLATTKPPELASTGKVIFFFYRNRGREINIQQSKCSYYGHCYQEECLFHP